MGIPLYLRYLLKRLKKYSIEGPSIPCSALYLDANSIIHKTLAFGRTSDTEDIEGLIIPDKVDGYKDIAAAVIRSFKQIISYYEPDQLVFISIDGPPPMGKIPQQKNSRYYSGAMMNHEGSYDSSLITPGTDYMFEQHKAIMDEIDKERDNLKDSLNVKKLIYSSHLIPGEGEHKIAKYIRQNKSELERYDGAHIIYGDDADLVLIALSLNLKNIYVCRSTVDITTVEGQSIVKKKDRHEPISINALRYGLDQELGHIDGDSKVNSFIFACTLLGNDFLPKTPLLSNMERSLDMIIYFISKLEKDLMDPAGLLILFNSLADTEQFERSGIKEIYTFQNLYDDYAKKEIDPNSGFLKFKSSIFDAMTDAGLFKEKEEKSSEEEISESEKIDVFRQLWYTQALYTPLTAKNAKTLGNMCAEYIRGLYWVYNYYTEGQDSVTWLWYYPYDYAPLFADIFKSFLALSADMFITSDIDQSYDVTNVGPVKGERRYNCLHQLLSVMPWQSYYVPNILSPFFRRRTPLLDMMPSGVVKSEEFAEAEHQKRIIVPKADYFRIMYELSLKDVTITAFKKYSNATYPYYENKLPISSRAGKSSARIVPTQRQELAAEVARTKSIAKKSREVREPKQVIKPPSIIPKSTIPDIITLNKSTDPMVSDWLVAIIESTTGVGLLQLRSIKAMDPKEYYDKIREIIDESNIEVPTTNPKGDGIIDDLDPYLSAIVDLSGGYVDLDVGNAAITEDIADRVNPGTTFATGLKAELENIVGINNISEVDDASIKLVTAIMVINHLAEIKKLFAEVYRVLVPGGLFIIKDHAFLTPEIAGIVLVEGMIYDYVLGDKTYQDALNDNKIYPRTKKEIINLGVDANFQEIASFDIKSSNFSCYYIFAKSGDQLKLKELRSIGLEKTKAFEHPLTRKEEEKPTRKEEEKPTRKEATGERAISYRGRGRGEIRGRGRGEIGGRGRAGRPSIRSVPGRPQTSKSFPGRPQIRSVPGRPTVTRSVPGRPQSAKPTYTRPQSSEEYED